jgi:hypothetical protein
MIDLPWCLVVLREFANGSRLARAVDARHEQHKWAVTFDDQRPLDLLQQVEQTLFKDALEVGRVGDSLPCGAQPSLLQQEFGRCDADIARQQQGLQLFVQRFVDLGVAAEQVGELTTEPLARGRQPGLEACQPAALRSRRSLGFRPVSLVTLEETQHTERGQRCLRCLGAHECAPDRYGAHCQAQPAVILTGCRDTIGGWPDRVENPTTP